MSDGIPSFARSPERRRNRRQWLRRGAYALVAVLAFSLGLGGVLAWNLLAGVSVDNGAGGNPGTLGEHDVVAPPRETVNPDEPMNILLLGTDAGLGEGGRRGPSRSDTVMLISIDPLMDDVSVLAIPRDTFVHIPVDELDPKVRGHINENPTKMAHAHAFGGPAVSMATVSELLDVPVHRYVRVNLDGFINIIDLVGGVDVCIKKDMKYADPYQDLYIDLKKGCQRLDGEHAMQYVRYRLDSDFARIERQQEVMSALADRALSLGIIPKLPQIVGELTRHVDTNLSEGELLRLAATAARISGNLEERLTMATIPGGDYWHQQEVGGRVQRVYYFRADEDALVRMVQDLIWRLEAPGQGVMRVRIQDASGSTGSGERLAEYLRQFGYEVLEIRESPPAEQTEILLHHHDAVGGRIVARALAHQLPSARVYVEAAEDEGEFDLTIVLGRDYAEAPVERP